MTPDNISEMNKAIDQAAKRVESYKPSRVPFPPPTNIVGGMTYSQTQGWVDSRKRKASGSGSGSAIEKAFKLGNREHLHSKIARMFYSSGLPFNLARNPYYVSSYSFAANSTLAGYLPPGYNLLRTTLLQKERANVDRLLQPIRSTWKEKGVSIVSDGWSDSQRRPLINFMAVTEGGPMFLKTVVCSGEIKDKYFIFGLIDRKSVV